MLSAQTRPATSRLCVAVATVDGRSYYRFARTLRSLGLRFDSILPSEARGYRGDLILSTRAELPSGASAPVIYEDEADCDPALLSGIILRKLGAVSGSELVLGVDPGSRIGLSVIYCGRELGTLLHTSVESLVLHMIRIMVGLGAKRNVVKIGNGNMAIADKIASSINLRYCSSFELELVNEHGTSPRTRNRNSRGKRDMHSASSIARREGSRRYVPPLSLS